MTEKYADLLARLHTLNDLQKSIAVLQWDRETNMPPQGNSGRTQQITTLTQLAHEIGTSSELGALLAAAETELTNADYDSTEASL
jgi:carboxypeptidase Taq